MKTQLAQNVSILLKYTLFPLLILSILISCEPSGKNSNHKGDAEEVANKNETGEKDINKENDEEILNNYKRAKELEKEELEENICKRTLENINSDIENNSHLKLRCDNYGLTQDFNEFIMISKNPLISCSEKLEKWKTLELKLFKKDKEFAEKEYLKGEEYRKKNNRTKNNLQ